METEAAIKKKNIYVIIILLVIACFTAFGRIAGNDFINFDDNKYITENIHTRSGFSQENIKWILTSVVVGNWHPLTMFSHTLDWCLFGDNPSGHHMVNLLLHTGAAVFLFLFLIKTTNNLWPSAFAVALFTLHPLRVESVAWLAERKDVLSMFFGTSCLYAYAFYIEKVKSFRYLLCLILFVLALMSKPMLITLPFVLMLLDYWPLGRWQKALNMPSGRKLKAVRKLLCEKIPFILLTIFFGIFAFWTQNKFGALNKMENIYFSERFSNTIVSYVTYLEKIFWPVNLAVYYPYNFQPALWKAIMSGVILLCITAVVLYYMRILPFLFIGWFWFLGTLTPVIGLVQIGSHALADRYTYLPSIGMTIIFSWGISLFFLRDDMRKKIFFSTGFVILALLTFLTWQQCSHWKNSITLFSHTLNITRNNYIAHNHLALALVQKQRFEPAIAHYNEAIRINPVYAHAYYNRGIAYYRIGQKMHALDDFEEASRMVQKNRDHASVYNNMGVIFTDLEQHQLAIEHYNEAIRLDPENGDALNNRAYEYLKHNETASGCTDARKACELGHCKLLDDANIKGLCH